MTTPFPLHAIQSFFLNLIFPFAPPYPFSHTPLKLKDRTVFSHSDHNTWGGRYAATLTGWRVQDPHFPLSASVSMVLLARLVLHQSLSVDWFLFLLFTHTVKTISVPFSHITVDISNFPCYYVPLRSDTLILRFFLFLLPLFPVLHSSSSRNSNH